MKRTPLRRGGPLRSGPGPGRQTPPTRRTPLRPGPWRKPGSGPTPPGKSRAPFAASEAQRAKMRGAACIVCQQTKGITPAHLAARSLGGCDHPDCVVPLCWMHHRAFDLGRLELLPYLEPRWRAEVAHAVLHLGLIGAHRRLSRRHDR
jgi:hypothetical protein